MPPGRRDERTGLGRSTIGAKLANRAKGVVHFQSGPLTLRLSGESLRQIEKAHGKIL
jgi:hypothetical protein